MKMGQINAEKALQTICKNNTEFEFRHDEYDNMFMAAKFNGRGELSGDGGVAFYYSYSDMTFGINYSTKEESIIISKKLSNEYSAEWYYEQYQLIFDNAKQIINKIK
jgi:hypothetical protein